MGSCSLGPWPLARSCGPEATSPASSSPPSSSPSPSSSPCPPPSSLPPGSSSVAVGDPGHRGQVVVQFIVHDDVTGVGVNVHSLTHLPLHRLSEVADQLHAELHLLLLTQVVVGAVLHKRIVCMALGVLQGFQVLAPTVWE